MSQNDLLSTSHDWRAEFKRLDGAFAPSTIKSYLTDVRLFVEWCEAKGLEPLPAEVDTVCAFLEEQAKTLCPSSVRRRLYAIRKVHRLLRLPDPTWDEAISITLRRVRRGKLNRPKQAKGMTHDYLQRCLDVQPDDPWGLRNRAMISLGYDLLTRRSELVALRTEDIEMRRDGTLRVLIRRSKADPFGMGRIGFSSKRSAMLVQQWLDWRGPDIDPLFCGIYQEKAIRRSRQIRKGFSGAPWIKSQRADSLLGCVEQVISRLRSDLLLNSCSVHDHLKMRQDLRLSAANEVLDRLILQQLGQKATRHDQIEEL